MNNIKSYEAIAREAEKYAVKRCPDDTWYWYEKSTGKRGRGNHNSLSACYKACCIENGLVEE